MTGRSETWKRRLAHPQKRGRLIELDILRGFLLLWMTFTHLPTKANLISNQTFGFVSGAEGFIFLAGFMVGQLEYRREKKDGAWAASLDLARRTFRVYAYHVGLLAITFTVFAYVAVTYHRQSLVNLLSYFFSDEKRGAIAALLLQYRPSLLDILPMYVVFMALTPLARVIAARWKWDPVIYFSFTIWAAAQFGLRHFVHSRVHPFGITVPEDSIGAFDLYGWQLLWMVALALGTIYADSLYESADGTANTDAALPPWLVNLSAAIVLVFLVLRYMPVDHWVDADVLGWLIDKWHLGPARVINFAALAVVLTRYGSRLARLKIFSSFAVLGQASLEVFCVHVLCCFVGHALSADADPNLPPVTQVLLLTGTLAALYATAYGAKAWNDYRKSLRQTAAA